MKKLFYYIVPSIVTMVMISMYSSIDTIFLGKYVSSQSMAAINLVIPYTNVMWGIAVMIASGACAYAGIAYGANKQKEASSYFSLGFFTIISIALLLFVVSLLFQDKLLELFQVPPSLHVDSRTYLLMLMYSSPLLMVKLYLEYYCRLLHKSRIAMMASILGLVINFVLDIVFIAIFPFGVLGASISTFLSILVPLLILSYVLLKEKEVRFVSVRPSLQYLPKIIYNGSSELFVEISTAIIAFFSNILLLHTIGELGVSAMSILTTFYYTILGVYVGLASGVSPLLSRAYGEKNHQELRRLLKHSTMLLLLITIGMVVLIKGGQAFWLSMFGSEQTVLLYTSKMLDYYVIGFLFIGFNIFLTTIFTSFGKGFASLLLSVLRSFIFVMISLFVMAYYFQDTGVFLAMPIAELMAFVLSISALYYLKKVITY